LKDFKKSCESEWNKDPVFGVIGIQSGPEVNTKICFQDLDLTRQPTAKSYRIGYVSGELLKLGIEIGQTSVAKYMARHRTPPSQGWKTFLRNHADGIVSMDLFVVPTLSLGCFMGCCFWIARQLTEACGWETTPRYIVRDATGSMAGFSPGGFAPWGIRDRPIAPRSPWQNGHTKRLIGSLWRECL
jgi:hypothetical protein